MSLITHLPARLDAVWTCGRAGETDQAFLREVFASTKAIELSLLEPDPAVRASFVAMQMLAQRRSAELYYPGAIELVLHHQGISAGRLWLHDDGSSLRIVDITLLQAFQGQGAARACLRALMHLADTHGRALHLHVLIDNPIRHWYVRLGFELTSTTGLYQAMTRLPTLFESEHEQA